MYVFKLPEIGEGVIEGEVVQWLVAEGDAVQVDQPLCEVMTDKATVEIPSPVAGAVHKLHVSEGDIVKVHSPLLDIDAQDTPKAATPAPAQPHPGRTLATPAVRAHARQRGVDIDTVAGSGKDGRVTRADVDAAVTAQPPEPPSPAPEPPSPAPVAPPAIQAPAPSAGQDERVRLVGLRRKIAEKMVESYRTIPHFTYVDEFDATALVALRRGLKAQAAERGVGLTYLAFIMKALVRVFRDFPTINAIMDEERQELIVRGQVNIGVAIDTEAGLYVPVVHGVDRKSILELAAEIADLSERTRLGKVAMHELQGGTFTVTSVGNIGGRFATPIINHPQVAILGVNQIHPRPVAIDGQVVVRDMMYLSPSFDHRVIDGAVAARFTSALKAVLENPASLLLDLR